MEIKFFTIAIVAQCSYMFGVVGASILLEACRSNMAHFMTAVTYGLTKSTILGIMVLSTTSIAFFCCNVCE